MPPRPAEWKTAWQSDEGESEFAAPMVVTGKISRRESFTVAEYRPHRETVLVMLTIALSESSPTPEERSMAGLAHLVGALAFRSAEESFRKVAVTGGPAFEWIPDGEPGDRACWTNSPEFQSLLENTEYRPETVGSLLRCTCAAATTGGDG